MHLCADHSKLSVWRQSLCKGGRVCPAFTARSVLGTLGQLFTLALLWAQVLDWNVLGSARGRPGAGDWVPRVPPDWAWVSAFRPEPAQPPARLRRGAGSSVRGSRPASSFAAISTKMIERIFSGAVTR